MDKKTLLFECIDRLVGITGCQNEAEAAKAAYHSLYESTSVPEGILLNFYDSEVATDIGPNGAYNKAVAMAEERFPYLEFPQTREDFRMTYGYDINTQSMNEVEKTREFSDFLKNLGDTTGAHLFCEGVIKAARQLYIPAVEAVDNMATILPDDKVYLSKDGTQVLTIHWSKQWEPSDDDYDEDGNEVENNLDCYTLGDLYDVQEGFDISKLPSDPYEVEQLEGKGVTLKANLAQLMRDSANLPTDEDVVDEYVGDPSYWTLVSGNTLVEAVGSDGRDVWSLYRESYSTRLPFQEEKRPRNIAMTEKMIWCGKCGQRKRLSNDDLDNEVAGYYGEPLGYICKDCAKDMGIYDTEPEDED